jgi:hypothetical protein
MCPRSLCSKSGSSWTAKDLNGYGCSENQKKSRKVKREMWAVKR